LEPSRRGMVASDASVSVWMTEIWPSLKRAA
jgi:hypothetical protein